MPPGRKPEWPLDVRAAVISAVMDGGESLNGTIRRLHEGKLGQLGKVPVPASTARSWIDTEKRQRARAERPDITAWNAAADRFWRVVSRELDKLEREAAKAASLDPKRLNGFMATLKDARELLAEHRDDRPQPGAAPSPNGLAERLAAQQHSEPRTAHPEQPAASDPPTSPNPIAENAGTADVSNTAQKDEGGVGPVLVTAPI